MPVTGDFRYEDFRSASSIELTENDCESLLCHIVVRDRAIGAGVNDR